MASAIRMRALASLWSVLVISVVVTVSIASADTVETFIKQLKDPSSAVRIKAAEELCVS